MGAGVTPPPRTYSAKINKRENPHIRGQATAAMVDGANNPDMGNLGCVIVKSIRHKSHDGETEQC